MKDTQIVFSNDHTFIFGTVLSIRVCDLNYGAHLGNDSFVSLIHEARAQFFHKYGWTETNIDNTRVGIIMKDLVVNYKSQGKFSDKIRIDISIRNLKSRQFDMLYLLTKIESQEELGRCMTRFLFFDYRTSVVVKRPKIFKEIIEAEEISNFHGR
jgi:acyl-CoA thioesterase FadM